MSLEKVKNTVLEAAKARADKLLADARREADGLVAEGRAANERKAAEAVREAKIRFERDTTRELERIQYANRLDALAAKNAAIGEVFKRVKNALDAMPEDDYVAMVGKWLAALPADAGGTIRVNPKDEAKFSSRLADLNKGRKGAGKFVKVEADPKVGSGAIVEGPDFNIDCTVERRLGELREATVGDLAKTLFGS